MRRYQTETGSTLKINGLEAGEAAFEDILRNQQD